MAIQVRAGAGAIQLAIAIYGGYFGGGIGFLMMAAHDTLTSSITSFVAQLAAHPQWQQKLRAEVASLGLANGDPMSSEHLEQMKLTEMAFQETLRLMPPVPSRRG